MHTCSLAMVAQIVSGLACSVILGFLVAIIGAGGIFAGRLLKIGASLAVLSQRLAGAHPVLVDASNVGAGRRCGRLGHDVSLSNCAPLTAQWRLSCAPSFSLFSEAPKKVQGPRNPCPLWPFCSSDS